MAIQKLYIHPNDLDVFRTHCPFSFTKLASTNDPANAQMVVGGVTKRASDVFYSNYTTWGYGSNQPNDFLERTNNDIPRACCYLANVETETVDGVTKAYITYDDETQITSGRFGLSWASSGNGNSCNISQISIEGGYKTFGYDKTTDNLDSALWGTGKPVSVNFGSLSPIPTINFDANDRLLSSLVIDAQIPIFIDEASALHYIETGETLDNTCFNFMSDVDATGSNFNKYCQTEILSMKPNGADKSTIFEYYYTYKMNSNQDIAGYVKDDENIQNVRFKAKNNTALITIVDNGTNETWTVTGSEFNNNFYGNSYGCSTKREHTLFGGNICWGTFGRMNIYIFDTEAQATQYLQDGDPSKAINYDDIDNYSQRDANKTGEDAGDQKHQNNALVTGWAEPSLSNVYILNSTKMEQVAGLVFPDVTTAGELPQQIKDLKASLGLYGENPINDIIDVWHCPFNPNQFVEREQRNLWFGSYRSEITGTHVTAHGKIVSMGATVISPIYNDFRDYDMEITLYLPYFGTVELPCDIYVGKKLEVKATLDLRSHNVRYYIFANDTLIEYHDCAVGTCYPLMGQDVAGKANQVMHAYNNLTTAKRNATITNGMGVLNTAFNAMTGNGAGAFTSALQTGANAETQQNNLALAEKNLKQDIKYTQPARSIVGNASPACSENDIPYIYLVFKIPQTIKPPKLQTTYGLPSNVITEIANVSGYAQIENVQLASNLPSDIKADILAKLSAGVIIN